MKQLPIFWISLFDQICITISFPLLTFICFDKSSSLFAVATSHAVRSLWYGAFWGLPHLIAIITAPLLALFSDKFGRKKVMLIGAFGALGFSILLSFGIIFGSIFLILIGSVICGLCVRTEPIALAAIADSSDKDNKLIHMGGLQFFISIGAFIGPIISGYFAKKYFFPQLNFAFPCIIGVFFGLLTLLITAIFFKETNKVQTTSINFFSKFIKYARDPFIRNLSLLLVLSQIAWRFYYQYITPILKIAYHFSNFYIGVFTGFIALWLIIGSSLGVKYFDKYLKFPMMIRATLFLMLYGLIAALSLSIVNNALLAHLLIWSSSISIAMGDVILYSIICTLFSNHVPSTEQGAIMGISFILVSLVWAITGFLGGALEALSLYLPILFGLSSIGILFFLPVHVIET